MEAATATDADRKSLAGNLARLLEASVGGLGKVLELAGCQLEGLGAEVARDGGPNLLARLGSGSPTVLLATRLSPLPSASSGAARAAVSESDPQQASKTPVPAASLALTAVMLGAAGGLSGRFPGLGMELILLGDRAGRLQQRSSGYGQQQGARQHMVRDSKDPRKQGLRGQRYQCPEGSQSQGPLLASTAPPSHGFLLDAGGSLGEVILGSSASFRVRGRFLGERPEVAEGGEGQKLAAACAMESIEAMQVERSEGEGDIGLDLLQGGRDPIPPGSDFILQADAWGGDVHTATTATARVVESVAWAVGSAEADAVVTIERNCAAEVAGAGSLPARIAREAFGTREIKARLVTGNDPRFIEDLCSLGCPSVGIGSGPAAYLAAGTEDAGQARPGVPGTGRTGVDQSGTSRIELLLEVTYALLERAAEEIEC